MNDNGVRITWQFQTKEFEAEPEPEPQCSTDSVIPAQAGIQEIACRVYRLPSCAEMSEKAGLGPRPEL